MKQVTNPLLCNTETGICEVNEDTTADTKAYTAKAKSKPIKIIYFTDPICSSCWGIEPQLRKLKLEYGNDIAIEYHMGGLLPDWNYNSGGISKPSDVAHHWDEVSLIYKMPIDGDIWLQDPLHSSYPPSIAFKAAQFQDEQKAIVFLRLLKEMVFLYKKNITKWEHIETAAKQAGLDIVQLKKDYAGSAKENFEQDLALARQMRVRGFPSIFISDANGNSTLVYGVKPYEVYEQNITQLYPLAVKSNYTNLWHSLFEHYPTLTTREFAELSNISFSQAEEILYELLQNGQLQIHNTKNGALWIKK